MTADFYWYLGFCVMQLLIFAGQFWILREMKKITRGFADIAASIADEPAPPEAGKDGE